MVKEKVSPLLKKKPRSSNLELYRIILMLGIIAHHYVVNSGLNDVMNFGANPANTLYLYIFGWFGKTGINCFLLITGYFMCKQNFSWQKLLKLYLEIKFYKFVIYGIFLATGYQSFSIGSLFKTVFGNAYGMNAGFTTAFIALYIFIPFLNILIKHMSKRQHLAAIGVLVLIFTVTGTFFFSPTAFEFFGWYINIYLIGSFLRLYPVKILNNRKVLITAFILCNIIVWISIFALIWLPIGKYYFVSDSHKIMALLTSVIMFCLFKNIDIGTNKVINTIASSVFGVFLIHTNSDAMIKFLWQDVVRCTDYYNVSFGKLVLHSIFCVIAIFIICVVIDQVRIHLLEKPLFRWIDKNSERIENFFRTKSQKLLAKVKSVTE
ncbi:MAG: acyltransferase [Clostridia bacterium]|nr:acyltransferase [Clostridia bacterium]